MRFSPYRRPFDPAGYRLDKYPSTIGLDSDKVKCSSCRHYDCRKRFCILEGRAVKPDAYCKYFGRRGL